MDSIEQSRMEKDLEWSRGIDESERPEGSTAGEDGLLTDLTASASGAAEGSARPGDEDSESITDGLRAAKDALLGRT